MINTHVGALADQIAYTLHNAGVRVIDDRSEQFEAERAFIHLQGVTYEDLRHYGIDPFSLGGGLYDDDDRAWWDWVDNTCIVVTPSVTVA